MQGRIALTNKPGQIRVTWTSLGRCVNPGIFCLPTGYALDSF